MDDLLSHLLDTEWCEQCVRVKVLWTGHVPGHQLVKEVTETMRYGAVMTEVEECYALCQLRVKIKSIINFDQLVINFLSCDSLYAIQQAQF